MCIRDRSITDGNSLHRIALRNPNPCILPTEIRYTVSHCRGVTDRNAIRQTKVPQDISHCNGFPICISGRKFVTRYRIATGSPFVLPTKNHYTVSKCITLTRTHCRRKFDRGITNRKATRLIGLQRVPYVYCRRK